ncbi:MAG: cytochrome c oxidase subunit 1 [Candidatus Nitrosocaldaceae archaeon]|nr:MAG: cytochrome c oxidase subunit 1 [Candidatus Nitrosocaldaceae archaeon]
MVLEIKRPRPLWEILFSTHHTDVALLYFITSFAFLLMGGALALTIRTELLTPGPTIIDDPSLFNRIFTVHGTTMLFLWVVPFTAAIGNYLIPILIKYKDMAYPRVNAVAYWMIPPGAALVWLGWFDGGWYAYPPYSIISAPGPAADMWIFGLKILGLASILGSINFIVTILKCKHPDLPLMKTSFIVWAILVTSMMTLAALPTFTAGLIMLYTDRLGVSGFFDPNVGGDPIAYQHLFWFTFHPEVYIFLLPAVGMAYELIPKFSRKPLFSYGSGVAAFGLLMIIGFASWAHHMLATGMSFTEKTVFMVGTLAAVPASAMHIFNWIATMWGGRIKLAAPMKFVIGGIMLFFASGAGGVVNTTLPLDFITHDSYWVVGHFHLMLMGTVSMIFLGFTYYIYPFITGRMYNERVATVTFWLIFIGNILVFITQHILGLLGMPRRIFDYVADPELIIGNQLASIGAYMIGIGIAIMVAHLAIAAARGKEANMEDPFEIGEQYYDYRAKEPHH